MTRSKKLFALVGILAAVCVLTVVVATSEQKKENIKISGETVFSVPVSSVTGFTWEQDGEEPFTFHKEEDRWVYDADPAFPASGEKIEGLLLPFEDFKATFTIEGEENFGDYGLDDPEAILHLHTADGDREVRLGAFSEMDQQRYFSIGDGNAYLASHDPYEEFGELNLEDVIENDTLPDLSGTVQSIRFTGADSYEVVYQAEGGPSFRAADLWFAQRDGELLPLDPGLVDQYIQHLGGLSLLHYADYDTQPEELASFGLDEPEVTITVACLPEEKGNTEPRTFTLRLGRDPKEVEEQEAMTEEALATAPPVSSYIQLEGSPIVYRLDSVDYELLSQYTYDDLRHDQVLPADIEDVKELTVTLGDETCLLTSTGKGEDRVWSYEGEQIDSASMRSNLSGLRVTDFSAEPPADRVEVAFTATLDQPEAPTFQVELHRCDSASCLAVVDGSPVGLVPRAKVVDFMEAINSILLGGNSDD